MQLTQDFLNKANSYATPCLLTDLTQITKNYHRLKNALPNTIIHYAVKSNNDLSLVKHLFNLGSNFDVASWQEIEWAKQLGIPGDRLVFSAPIKPIESIKKAYDYGVKNFSYDSLEELEKIYSVAPQAKLILRILVDSEGSQCPMFKKFGVYIDHALEYLQAAVNKGMEPIGLTFHVGSQCLRQINWVNALHRANIVWDQARKAGIQLKLINLGGGLPVEYDKKIDPIEVHASTIKTELAKNFKGMEKTFIEPGRYMTDQASIMVTTVIGKANRGETNWVFIDVGGFNGLFEIFEHFNYDIKAPYPDRPKVKYAVAGPTCDGLDVIRKSIIMHEVNLGDRVYIMNAGAYSISKEKYNGMSFAKSYTY